MKKSSVNQVSDMDLHRNRVRSASNSDDLLPSTHNALKLANDIEVGMLAINIGLFPVTLRRYVMVAFSEVESWSEVEVEAPSNLEGKRVRKRRSLATKKERLATVWEVQGFWASMGGMSGFWVYDDVAAASSCLAHMLMAQLDIKVSDAEGRSEVDLCQLLSGVLTSMGMAPGGAKVVPREPRTPKDEAKACRDVLAIKTLEARETGASVQVRKQLAVDLYNSGERNIRRISMLAGVSRDTVYAALRASKSLPR